VSNSGEPVDDEFLIGGNERRDIVVVDYDLSWPARFEVVRAKITTAFGAEAMRIEHVGSTAVPGPAAKPIIDVLVTVADVEDEPRYLPALQGAGYVLRVREPGHRLVRAADGDVTAGLVGDRPLDHRHPHGITIPSHVGVPGA
jgi:GrpB-like predicted nucleotidyltransferase (UPF0157 family)